MGWAWRVEGMFQKPHPKNDLESRISSQTRRETSDETKPLSTLLFSKALSSTAVCRTIHPTSILRRR